MDPIEVYKRIVAAANRATFEVFGVHGPYEPGSKEHDFWISKFDEAASA